MERISFKRAGKLWLLVLLILLTVYSFFCQMVYQDRSLAARKKVPTPVRGPHSGSYYMQAAEYLQYAPHAPGEIDRLYQNAMIHSPADGKVFMSYFQYLQSRNCCADQASRAIYEATRRSPASTKPYAVAIAYFLDLGRKEEAFAYFKKAIEMEPDSARVLFSLIGSQDLSVEEIVRITPRNTEGLSFLAEYLSRQGPSQKEEWYRTVKELHSIPVEPDEILRTAEQAFHLDDLGLARRYAEMAWNYPETQSRAKKLLDKLSRKKMSR